MFCFARFADCFTFTLYFKSPTARPHRRSGWPISGSDYRWCSISLPSISLVGVCNRLWTKQCVRCIPSFGHGRAGWSLSRPLHRIESIPRLWSAWSFYAGVAFVLCLQTCDNICPDQPGSWWCPQPSGWLQLLPSRFLRSLFRSYRCLTISCVLLSVLLFSC